MSPAHPTSRALSRATTSGASRTSRAASHAPSAPSTAPTHSVSPSITPRASSGSRKENALTPTPRSACAATLSPGASTIPAASASWATTPRSSASVPASMSATSPARRSIRGPSPSCVSRSITRRTDSPLVRGACRPSTYPFNAARVSPSFRRVSAQSAGCRVATHSTASRTWSYTSRLLARFECSSRQKGPSPSCSSRPRTTVSAARFSATNSTRSPRPRASAITFAIVWLFPVPGGPCSTKVSPAPAARTASSWLESASRVHRGSPGASTRSRSGASGTRTSWDSASSPSRSPVSISRRTRGLCRRASDRSSRSSHIRCRLKLKSPSTADSRTSHRSIVLTASRKRRSTASRSIPLSSSGSSPSDGSAMPNSMRSFSRSGAFVRGDSSPMRTIRGRPAPGRSRRTGTRTRGASLGSSLPRSYHTSVPRARCSRFAPVSSRLDRASRKSSTPRREVSVSESSANTRPADSSLSTNADRESLPSPSGTTLGFATSSSPAPPASASSILPSPPSPTIRGTVRLVCRKLIRRFRSERSSNRRFQRVTRSSRSCAAGIDCAAPTPPTSPTPRAGGKGPGVPGAASVSPSTESR